MLEDAIAAYPDQFSADIALSDIYLEQQQTAAAKDVMAKAYSRGGDQLPVLKQYTKVLATQGAAPWQTCWTTARLGMRKNPTVTASQWGCLAQWQ